MKTHQLFIPILSIAIFILSSNNSAAQTSFSPHTLDGGITSPSGVYSGDLDMDGDIDVVAGSGVNGIAWWRNDGGDPITWTKQTIDANIGICFSVFIADIFRDGYPDVVAVSTDKNQLVYYKNNGGDPISWAKYTISTDVGEPHEVYACDFDSDGNQDVFAACMGSNEISWWRNNGGDPVTWTKQVLSTDVPGARSVHVGDIDGDGDNDVAGASFGSDEVIWWQNNGGSPVSWTKNVVTNNFDGSHRVQIEDIDNDGDNDIIATAFMAASIVVWINEDGLGTQWTEKVVDTGFTGAVIGLVVDINSDGWLDILGTAQDSNQVTWYMNKGGASLDFKKYQITEDFPGVWPAHAGDFDNDLDIDILVGGFDANELRWYENKQVGRFTSNIQINDTPTNLGFFVPEEYDPEQAYKLIVAMHICGDANEYSRYRDNLIELCLQMNAILVAPDCQNTINNLDVPDPAYILDAIEYAKTRFHIDEEFVYLTGGSCNGRSALKFGLGKVYNFRGVIPFNPYLPDWSEGYYDFTSDMPVCFASGTNDPNYSNTQVAYNLLLENKSRAGFVSMPGVGHEFYIPEFTEVMLESIRIIDSINQSSTAVNRYELEPTVTKVYPNPFSDRIIVQFQSNINDPLKVSLYDMSGKEIYSEKFDLNSIQGGQIELNLPGEEIPSNIYILRILSQNGSFMKKLTKH